jgi:hypothetical protein
MRTIESIFNEYDYGIPDDKQNFIKLNWGHMSTLELAKIVFDKTQLDERSEEVRSINKLIIKLKRDHKPIELDEDQRKMVRDLAPSQKPLEIARQVFNNNSLKPLSKEAKTVDKYIKVVLKLEPDNINDKSTAYSAPKSLIAIIKKVNFSKPELNLSEEKLTGAHRKYIEQLRHLLANPRFIATVDTIRDTPEKELFEHTFIEGCYGKELNSEEINMYISLCSDYVLQKQIKGQLDLLNDELKSSTEDEDKSLKISLVEAFGKKASEYNECSKRIKGLQESLSGSRSKRIETQAMLSASLVSFVEAWKSEDERQRAVIIARATQKKVGEVLDMIEDEDQNIARILGISKEEILHG